MNPRPRDSQRRKVYRSENGFDRGDEFNDFADLRQYVFKIYRSRWRKGIYKKYGLVGAPSIRVKDGRSRSRACMENDWSRTYTLKFPRRTRNQFTVLHEIAHIMTEELFKVGRGERAAYHGREFCAILLQLVRRWMGTEAANDLKSRFKQNKVKHTMPPLEPIIRCPRCGNHMKGVLHV